VRPIGLDETVVEAVIQAVSEATGRPPVPDTMGSADALDDLCGAVDPDALAALVTDRFDGRLEFDWSGCRVAVEGDTHVVVEPLD